MKKPKKIERAREKRLRTAILQVIGPRSELKQVQKMDHIEDEPMNDMLQEEEEMIIYSRRMEYEKAKKLQKAKKKRKKKHRIVTKTELSEHFSKLDAWTSIKGNVYDITEFANEHPGGGIILQAAGIDGTQLFSKPLC